jgi:large subunit ribosomal protein L30
MDLVRIQQTRSPIRRHHKQRRTLIGLGLNKIGRIAEVPFTSSTWGMIYKVRHLVRFPDEDLFEEHRVVRPQPVDEAADKELMRQLVFNLHQILLEPFTQEEMHGRKTPDFKLIKAGKLVGYCELKSPRDDWIFDVPTDLKPGEVREESRRDSTAHNLARNIRKAAEQFKAVNPNRQLPDILVLVSHARLRDRVDLHMAISGIKMPDGSRRFLLVDSNEKDWNKAWEEQKKLWAAARHIDLFFWVDAHQRSCKHLINLDGARNSEARELFGAK